MKMDTYYISSYFRVIGKILETAFGLAFWGTIIAHFVFKVDWMIILQWVIGAAFISVPLIVASFFVVLVISIQASTNMNDFAKVCVGGVLAIIGIVLTRLATTLVVGFGENALPAAAICTEVTIGLMSVAVTVTLIGLVGCIKKALRKKTQDCVFLDIATRLKLGVFFLGEIQVLIVSVFLSALFYPASWLFKANENPLVYSLILLAAVLGVLCVLTLIKGIVTTCAIIEIKKSHAVLHDRIMQNLDVFLYLSEEEITYICESENSDIIIKYPSLIRQILGEEVSKGELKKISVDGEAVYTTRDSKKVTQEYFKKISIFNKKDLPVLACAMLIQILKSVVVYPQAAKKLGFGNFFKPEERLDHDDKLIKDAERKALSKYMKKFKNNISIEDILNNSTVPYDMIKGGKEVGLGISGNNHRAKTLGHDPFLGWIFGTINIITNTITDTRFNTYRVVGDRIMPGKIPFFEVFTECYTIIREKREILIAAFAKQACHLESDEYTKRGLPIPVLGTICKNLTEELYGKHYDYLCFKRDLSIIGFSQAFSEFCNMIIRMIHVIFYDPQSENRELYRQRTEIIIALSSGIGSACSIVSTVKTKNINNLDIGGILVSLSHIVSTPLDIMKRLWDLTRDPSETPEVQAEIEKYKRIKAKVNSGSN